MVDKLEIVNHMLQVVGSRRTPTLETGHPDVVSAIAALDGFNNDFQGEGWWFNKDFKLKLLPDNNGEITLPGDLLSLRISYPDNDLDKPENKQQYVTRGTKLYDTINHTYVIGTSVYVDIITLIQIDNLPHNAKTYLKHLAASQYYTDDDGDITKANKLEERMTRALITLKAEQLRNVAPNALQSPAAQSVRYRIGQYNSPSNPAFPGGRYR